MVWFYYMNAVLKMLSDSKGEKNRSRFIFVIKILEHICNVYWTDWTVGQHFYINDTVFFENVSTIYFQSHFSRLRWTCSTNSVVMTQILWLGESCRNSQFSIAYVIKILLLPSELSRLQQPKWYCYFSTADFACSLCPMAVVRHFLNPPYRRIGIKRKKGLYSMQSIPIPTFACMFGWDP